MQRTKEVVDSEYHQAAYRAGVLGPIAFPPAEGGIEMALREVGEDMWSESKQGIRVMGTAGYMSNVEYNKVGQEWWAVGHNIMRKWACAAPALTALTGSDSTLNDKAEAVGLKPDQKFSRSAIIRMHLGVSLISEGRMWV